METLFILALLASNIWLIGKVFKKNDNVPQKESPQETPPKATATKIPSDKEADDKLPISNIVGESKLDMAKVEGIIARTVKETVPMVLTEYTRMSDVKFADEPESMTEEQPAPATSVQNNLNEMFTHVTVDEITGETAEAQPPREGGHGFKELEAAVRVAKNEPHTDEEAVNSKIILTDIQGTELGERLSLDPKVRHRLMAIVFGEPDEPVNEETLKDKNVIFSATVDTFNVDSININILS